MAFRVDGFTQERAGWAGEDSVGPAEVFTNPSLKGLEKQFYLECNEKINSAYYVAHYTNQ